MPRFFFFLLLILLSSTAHALEELIDSTWLKANIGTQDLFLLDIRQPGHYRRYHIPGSINAPYDTWRTGKISKNPGMLPPLDQMEQSIGDLGISSKSIVVIISAGNYPSDMAAASRVFWTLKVLGHTEVGILNGGLLDYAKRYPRDLEVISRSRAVTRYKLDPVKNITADRNDVLAALHNGTQLLDARTLGEFVGVITAQKTERPGTIPGSKHLPFDWFVNSDSLIRGQKDAVTLFTAAGLDPKQDGTIHFCHTGNRAALTWFVDYAILGNRNAKLYDASMIEWAIQKELPIETRIDLKSATQSSANREQQ